MTRDFSHLTFVWLSFGPDSRCLAESVASVRLAAPGARLVVLEDGAAPITDDVRAGLSDVVLYASEWDRRGNNRGLEHLSRQMLFFSAIAPDGGAVVKTDSDVVWLSADWLHDHDWERHPVASVSQPSWWFQGTYGLRSGIMWELADAVARAPEICPRQGPVWPEDCVTGELAAAILGPDSIAHYHGYPLGPAVAHYDYAANAPLEPYFGYHTVNFGGRARMKAPESLRRSLAADTMRAFRAAAAAAPRRVT